MVDELVIKKTDIKSARELIDIHMNSLAFPLDCYLEDFYYTKQIFLIKHGESLVGYFVSEKDDLFYFHVVKEYYRYAPKVFEKVIKDFGIKNVTVITQDPQIQALLVEWDCELERMGCFFSDSGVAVEKQNKIPNAIFRAASKSDIPKIKQVCGNFFDEASGGFTSLRERIDGGTIFILEEGDTLYSCGIIEIGRIMNGFTSIGMFVNPEHRKKGAAKTMLLNLKDYVYKNNSTPVAGCWYYNTLSRKSLESAGMIVTSLGYITKIIEKDNPPVRTGNPPGELVK